MEKFLALNKRIVCAQLNISYANLISLRSLQDYLPTGGEEPVVSRYFAFIFSNRPPAVRRQFKSEATSTVNITQGAPCIFRKNSRATSPLLLYIHISIQVYIHTYIALFSSLPLSAPPRPLSGIRGASQISSSRVPRKVNLLYAPCAKQIRPLSARPRLPVHPCTIESARERGQKKG